MLDVRKKQVLPVHYRPLLPLWKLRSLWCWRPPYITNFDEVCSVCAKCVWDLLFGRVSSRLHFTHFSLRTQFVRFSTQAVSLWHKVVWLNTLPLKGNFQELLFAPLFSLSLEQRVTCSWSQKLFSEARGLSSPGVMWNLAQQQFLEPFNLPNPKQLQHQKMKFLKSW